MGKFKDLMDARKKAKEEEAKANKPNTQLSESVNSIIEEVKMKNGKGLLRSRTFWANAITAAISIGTYFTASELITPDTAVIFTTVIGGLNVILRLLTSEPIAGTPAAK
jgi:hypothetical protein